MRTLVLFFATLLVGLNAAPAAAGPREEAREHYEHATSEYALGNYETAALEYEKAFALKADAALLYNAAQAHRQGGNKKRALVLYQNYLHVFGDRAANREEVQRLILNLKKAIADDEQMA